MKVSIIIIYLTAKCLPMSQRKMKRCKMPKSLPRRGSTNGGKRSSKSPRRGVALQRSLSKCLNPLRKIQRS
jgi:hypothetical protein